MTVLVVMAMRAESAPVVSALGLDPDPDTPHIVPLEWYCGEGVTLAVNGTDPYHDVDSIGTTAAALTTMLSIERWDPRWVVSAGTAGGFEARGGHVGQVVLAHGPIIHHDRRIPLAGFEAYGRGGYPTADLRDVAAALGFTSGACSTGDSLDAPPHDLEVMEAHGTLAKDMEAAAVAGVAQRMGRDFTALKVITDLVDTPHPTAEQFLANLQTATGVLAESLPRLVDALHSYRRGGRPS